MTAATIIVLVIGVILIVVSFFLTGKSEETEQEERVTPGMPDELTEADKKQLRKLTDTFIRDYSKKQVKEIARNTIDSRVQDAVAAKQPAIEERVGKIDQKLDEADAKIDEMESKAASLGDGLATYAGQIAAGWDQNQVRVNEVMEQIALRIPLSNVMRPAWDRAVLSKLGMEVSTDVQAWDRVWSEEEKINFASTPLFLVHAVRAGGAV